MSTDGEGETSSPSWIFWAMASVFGGLRSVVEFVWKWGQVPFGTVPMDTLNTLLLGWLAFALLIIVLAKFLYDKFLGWDQSEEEENEFLQQEEGSESQKPPAQVGEPSIPSLNIPIIARKATIVPEELPEHVPAPVASGGDPDAVRWINNLLVWFFEGSEGGYVIRNSWNDHLNEFTVGSALETGVLIEILEFLPQTPAPKLTNVIVDCAPNDDITVTCDMTATLYMRVQTTRTQHDVTTESEYAVVVRPLRSRLNVAVTTHQCVAYFKFDGWPEVNMELEGVRNNTEGLDEIQLQEVVKEELTSALRKVTLELDFLSRKTFPRFSRERALPENVIPVGYDSLVRERQTHPPSFEPKVPASRTPVPPRSQKVQSGGPKEFFESPSGGFGGGVPKTVGGPPPFLDVLKPVPSDSPPLMSFRDEPSPKRENFERTMNEANMERVKPPSPPPRKRVAAHDTSSDFAPGHPPLSRLSMVFSSREKPIDEPTSMAPPIAQQEEEEEEVDDDLFFQELKIKSLTKAASPPKSPTRELESLKESLKGPQWKNPFGKHEPRNEMNTFLGPQPVPTTSPVGIVGLNGKRLLVKVVKATGVGGDAGVSSCYVVVEMDDPAQKFTTNVVTDSSSPFWDEQFLFDLSDNTLELLFELYDKSDDRFVGLGIVGIEELVATPSQRQIIPLQARPYEKDEVTGSLTCEFLFLDRADLPDLTLRKTTTGQTASGKLKTTTYTKPSEDNQPEEEIVPSTEGVAETALKDLEGRQGGIPLAPNARSTLIIHASKKPVEEHNYEEEDADYKPGVSADLGTGFLAPTGTTSGTTQKSAGASGSSTPQGGNVQSDIGLPPPSNIYGMEESGAALNGPSSVDDRGRSRSRRKRDFFGSLRRRFSRSKLRSKSVEPTAAASVTVGDESLDRDPLSGRSVSMERSAAFGRSRGTLTVPTIIRGRSSPSGGGLGSGDSGSTRSSLSGTSGLSSASTKTYINEASLLVVETLENGVVKHYLVPLSLQRKNKWRKKGTKLHIYNEHTFVAKHLSSSVTCQVCQKGIGRRLGKQGYECRDCSYKCHKPCHVKADIVCPNSTVNSMDLVYVKDEKAERRKRLLSS